MAIVQNPITGRSKQKMGNVVFSTIFGKNVLKSKPLTVANPRTDKQKTQREKFSAMIETLRIVLPFVKIGYKIVATGMSAFNKANMENIKVFLTGTTGAIVKHFDLLSVAMGSLSGVQSGAAVAAAGRKVTFSWDDNSGQGDAQATDIAMMIIVSDTKRNMVMDVALKTRADLTHEFTVPSIWIGEDVHCYMCFKQADTFKVCDSVFCSTVTVVA